MNSVLHHQRRREQQEQSPLQLEGAQLAAQRGRYPIKTHGAKVARDHLHDWLILMLLVTIEVGLFVIHPFYRFVGQDMMAGLKYPMKDNTVPVWAVPIYSVLLPICVFIFVYFRRRDVHDLHHSVLDAVGRPRPDFFWRCFPDGKDGHLQGSVFRHSTYLEKSKYLIAKDISLPLLVASLVAVFRVDDYWHHWNDVFASGFIGLVVATFCYRQFFPNPYDDDGWGPYAYFDALVEESSNDIVNAAAQTTNALTAQATEVHVVNQTPPSNEDNFSAPELDYGSTSRLEDIELGRR
ncbi:Detected protein of confused Function [Hibiscus syriacus]|uniref:Detected protein of confused Function n=1 Tax=Hibiscus syriacus TaxID=106335 RepID=A0A6A2ZM18_HIBSY|nr:Detected protein of confused Function [Hibiscus syriacus]